MANRFLSNITINDEYTFPSTDGTADQIISTNGAGTLSFIDPATLSVGESEQVHIACKNTSGVSISKGDPVYITGTVGASFIIQIAAADASNAAKMPAVGLVETDLGINAEGYVIVSGVLKNLTTDPLSSGDGTPSSNDTIYVKPGGGLTKTKPTGSGNYIQNVGKVGRVNNSNAGSIAVSTIMRTNDVPNLSTGKVWVGTPTYTAESTVIHLDESNARLGIGTPNPAYPLDVNGEIRTSSRLWISTIDALSISGSDLRMGYTNSNILLRTNSAERMRITSGGDVSFRDTSNNQAFYWDASASSLGIGTDSPSSFSNYSTLTVNGTNGGIINLKVAETETGRLQVFSGAFNIAAKGASTSLLFETNGAERMRIDSSGQTRFKSNTDYSIGLVTGGASGTDRWWLKAYTDGRFALHANGVGDHLTVQSGGNVGIGTTSPGYKLHAVGSGSVASFGDGARAFRVFTDSDEVSLVADGSVDMRFYTGGTQRMRINSGGDISFRDTSANEAFYWDASAAKLGIGTNSPTAPLTIFNSADPEIVFGYNSTQYHKIGYDSSKVFIHADPSNSNALSALGLYVDNQPAIYINSSQNVGIGIITPSEKLHVSGNARITGAIYDSNNSSGTSGQVLSSTATGTDWISLSAVSGVDGSGTTNYVAKWSDADTITDSVIFDNGTNVGIGTDSPAAKLDLVGGDVTGGLKISANKTTSAFFAFGADANETRITSTSYGNYKPLTIYTGGSERIRIDNGGDISFRDTSTNQAFYWDASAARLGLGTTSPTATLTAFNTGSDSAGNNPAFAIGDGNYHWRKTTDGSKLILDTYYGGWNPTFTVDRTSGSVGIGTTSPAAKLDISFSGGSDSIKSTSTNSTSYNSSKFYNDNSKGWHNLVYGSAYSAGSLLNIGADGTIIYGNTTSGITTVGAFNLLFGTNSTERMRIDSSGVVQVRNQTPTIQLYNTDTSVELNQTLGDIDWYQSDPSDQGVGIVAKIRAVNVDSIAGYGALAFHTGSATSIDERVRINYQGNVGINTISPLEKLEISDTSNAYARISATDGSNAGLRLNSLGNREYVILADNDLRFYDLTGSSDRMIIKSSGNVGIGTTSPSQKLTVRDDSTSAYPITLENSNIGIPGAHTGIRFGYINNTYQKGAIIFESQDSSGRGKMFFAMEATANSANADETDAKMTIDYSGNVGIGYTNPISKLDIANNMRITFGSGAQRLLMGNQDSAGANNPSMILAANGNFYFGGGNNWSAADGGTMDYTMTLLDNGNVGIGTTSPQNKIHIESNAADQFRITRTGVASWSFNTYGTGDLVIDDGTERMRIDSSGNVGIATVPFEWSSYGVLNVKGSGAIYGTSAGDTLSGLTHGAYYDGTNWKYTYTDVGATRMESVGTTSPYIAFYNANSGTADNNISWNERMRIHSGGDISFRDTSNNQAFYWLASVARLGLGTPSPTADLEVFTDAGGGNTLRLNTNFANGNSVDINPYISGVSNGGMEIKLAGSRKFVIDSSGNVGIGADSPSAKLDVVGTIECTSLTETSALRFKENIEENIDASIIDKLRPVSYDWKETGDKDYGFIAEEVDELDSILTTKEEDGQLIGIKYTKLIPFLVKKIQEQEKRIKQLENGKS